MLGPSWHPPCLPWDWDYPYTRRQLWPAHVHLPGPFCLIVSFPPSSFFTDLSLSLTSQAKLIASVSV